MSAIWSARASTGWRPECRSITRIAGATTNELAWTLRDQDTKALWKAVAEEAEPYQVVLASSEEFSLIKQARHYKPVRAAMTGFTTRPICYLRRQDQLLESTYNYHVKSLGETKSIMEFTDRIMKRLEFDRILGELATSFGEDAVIARVYDPDHLRGDIFDDFMATVGVLEPDKMIKPEKTLNPGLAREGLDRMLEANRMYQDAPERLNAERKKVLSTCVAPSWTAHEILTDSERHAVLRRFRPGNNQVARRFLDRAILF